MAEVGLQLKGIPTSFLTEEEIAEMVDAFRLGDFKLRDKFIIHHVRIAMLTVMGLKYDTEAMRSEMHSEAFLQLCRIPDEVHGGRLKDYGLIPYTISRIRTVCRNFMRSDRVFKIPPMTAWRTNKRVARVSSPTPRYGFGRDEDNFLFHYSCRNLALIYGLMDSNILENEQARELYKDIMSCVKTEGERLVISYRSQEYTDAEIAHIMGMSTTNVRNLRLAVEKRYKALKENQDES